MNEREARAVLTITSEPGDERIGALVAQHGAVEALQMVVHGVLRGGIRDRVAKAHASQELATAMRKLDACGGVFITPEDSSWPKQLDDLDLATPLGLWCRGIGDVNDLGKHSLAVVGARAATAYGERIASEVGSLAAEYGVTVVSGAAYGIDAAAHRGVLAACGKTIAVLACGVDVAYPSAHRGLLERIAENGLIVSEAPPGGKPHKRRFLVRNRIIAALSSSTLVVEAALRSGSLSTANWANAIGRAVWGVPGPITSATSAGVHVGIAQGEMNIAADQASVVDKVKPKPLAVQREVSFEESAILRALVAGPMHTDELVSRLRLSDNPLVASQVLGALTLLEIQGAITQTATGWKALQQ
jgi:DNA processing protein